MIRLGLELPCGGECADPRFLAELAAVAEAAGWEGVFLEDYIVYSREPDCPTADVWIALAAMAMSTTSVRLGTTVTAAARRRPWKLARELVTLDHLSAGRVTVGLGVGDPADDGIGKLSEERDPRARAQMLDEALAVLSGLLSGQRFSFSGKHFQVDGVRFLPTPVQPGGIPVWVGGGWPGRNPVRRAAAQNGFIPYHRSSGDPFADADEMLSPAAVRQIGSRLEELRGGDMAGFDLVIGGQRRRDDEAAELDYIAAVADAGATWFCEWIPPGTRQHMRAAAAREPLRP
jgi:alkanesulfonate monooxygenase SsuD/methylene tetrahydromethanopterin reductase-like flavin-dependent oxidoreductase (luciferase family)